MNRCFGMIAALLALALMSACSKNGAERFEGKWSYKTSGSVSVVVTDSLGITVGDTLTAVLATEAGQMHIAGTGNDGSMMLTMNAMAGNVTVYEAFLAGSEIVLNPKSRVVNLSLGGLPSLAVNVLATGRGRRYDDILLLRMDYSGSTKSGNYTYEITGSDVDCVATSND